MTGAGTGGPIVVGAISVLLGLVGIIGTRAWIGRPTGPAHDRVYLLWALGILAVLPAWVVVFVYLIPSGIDDVRTRGTGAVVWMCSIALGLTGAIMSEARLRHLHDSAEGISPARAWSFGLWAMIPAWVAMLLGLVAVLVAA
jgi:hypothetical protein